MILSIRVVIGAAHQSSGRLALFAFLIFGVLIPASSETFAADVTLAWDASPQPEVTGYNLYYGTAPGQYSNYVVCGNVTICTVTSLAAGTYYFAVTAYDASGGQSGFSNEVSTIIQAGTDSQPPVITSVTSTATTYTGATIKWITDEPADSQVEYGPSTAYGTMSAADQTLLTSHSVALDGLTPATMYHYRVYSQDAAGNRAVSGDYTFATPALPDTTPPTISGVTVSAVTASGATIAWTTNEASDSQVDYGTSMAYGASVALNACMVTAHLQSLSGLSGSTTYHYRVKSRDAAGNLAVSGDYTFTTPAPPDTTPPTISGVAVSAVTASGATIAWTTDEASESQVDYGTSTAYGASVALDASMVTAHLQSLTGLSGGTTYHYRVKSRDAAGNLAVSGDYSFATTTAADTTPPTISGVTVSAVTVSGATVIWTTNEASDSRVEYGVSAAYGNSTALNPSMVTGHSQGITGLASNTTYHYRVESMDAAGNLAVSADYTFTTSPVLDITTGLVAAYAFDEGTGSTTMDSSGNGNAAVVNGARWTTNAKFGFALAFNGRDSFVSAPVEGLPDISGPKTIACWVYVFGKTNIPQSIVALANASQPAAIELGIENAQIGDMQYGDAWLVATYPPSLRAWHHYAYTFDGLENRLYIDGTLASSSTIPPQAAPVSSFEFGRWITGSNYFKGAVDEVRVYNRPLDQDEIMAVMNTPIGNTVATVDRAALPILSQAEVESADGGVSTTRHEQPTSRPVVGIRMSRPAFDIGDTVSTKSYWIGNPSLDSVNVELKSWVSAPGLEPVAISPQKSKMLSLPPAGIDQDLGSLELFEVSSEHPAGTYWFNVRLIDPTTGSLLSEGNDSFSVGTAAGTAAGSLRRFSTGTPPWLAVENVIAESDSEGSRPRAEYRVANTGTAPVPLEVKVWLDSQEDGSLIPILSLGSDGSLQLPAGSDFSVDPLTSFLSANVLSPGAYQLKFRILDPVTGECLYEGLNYVDLR